MTTIHIPPAALKAGCSAYTAVIYKGNGTQAEFREAIRAAFEAMVGAWPGMNEENRNGFSFSPLPHGTAFRYTVIILPLPPQENSDAKR